MTCLTVIVPFTSYLTLRNILTLKFRLAVTARSLEIIPVDRIRVWQCLISFLANRLSI